MKFATIGTSWITESFIESLLTVSGTELYAVYSRNSEKSEAFCRKHGAVKNYTSLEKMSEDVLIDAVYIASPNICHYEQSKLFLQKGKHVLCEKPLCITSNQIKELYKIADKNNVVFCEAIMNLHSPDIDILRDNLSKIGVIHSAHLDFSQLSSKYNAYLRGEKPNIFMPNMGTGCLMDLGVYNVYMAYALFGYTEKISAQAVFLDTGADCTGSAILNYGDKVVTLTYSKTAQSNLYSQILGDKGVILIQSVSQIGNSELLLYSGEKAAVTSEKDRKQIMSYEVEDFIAYIKGDYKYITYEQARAAAEEVSVMMEIIREKSEKFQF